MDRISMIDTNVVFDIIYDGRQRHNNAIEMYKNFKNYELSISGKVKQECYKVVNDYSTRFSTELINTLKSQNRRGKNWDDMDTNQRSNFIKDFKNRIIKGPANDYTPFFKIILEKIEDDIIYLNMDTIYEYAFNITGMMDSYLYDAIKTRFSIIEPDINDTIKHYSNELGNIFNGSNFFSENQSQDLAILIELINVVGTYGDNLANLYFYTNDKTFRKIITKIKDKGVDIEDNSVKQYFNNSFDKITFKSFFMDIL